MSISTSSRFFTTYVKLPHSTGNDGDLRDGDLLGNREHAGVRNLDASTLERGRVDLGELVRERRGNLALGVLDGLGIRRRRLWGAQTAKESARRARQQTGPRAGQDAPAGKMYSSFPGIWSKADISVWKFLARTSLGTWAIQSVNCGRMC